MNPNLQVLVFRRSPTGGWGGAPKVPILGVLRFQRSLTDKRRENKETPIKKKRTKITATHFSPTITTKYHFIVEFMGFSSNGKGKERKPTSN